MNSTSKIMVTGGS